MSAEVIDTDNLVQSFYNGQAEKCEFVCNVNDYELPSAINDVVAKLHPETMKRYYGSGFVIPEKIEGLNILDIGCGSGSLAFILSKLVGPTGSITGIDYTENLITLSKIHQEYHREAWGHEKSNITFLVGDAHDLSSSGIKDQSFDIIVSNGVFCLTNDKDKVFAEAFRVLKPGGELFLSDVLANQNAPAKMHEESKYWVLGMTCSQSFPEFMASSKKAGFVTPALTGAAPINITEEILSNFPGCRYITVRNRLFRLTPDAKSSASSVTYKGDIVGHEDALRWDIDLTFKKGEAVSVDSEMASILSTSRFQSSFDFKDISTAPVAARGQNPFVFLDKLKAEGKSPAFAYTIE